MPTTLTPGAFPRFGQPFAAPMLGPPLLAKLYGMITNIDTNVGRLLAKLDGLKLTDNTMVIFMSDNGPQEGRFNAGLRGRKGTVYEGGIRVPFFVRWPDGRLGPRKLDAACAHVDIVPTLAAACGLSPPADRAIDGMDLLPLWAGRPQLQIGRCFSSGIGATRRKNTADLRSAGHDSSWFRRRAFNRPARSCPNTSCSIFPPIRAN